jgi:hypothetical protein
MRINGSERLTLATIDAAGLAARTGAGSETGVAECYARNSRSSVTGWDVYLRGSMPRRGRAGNADYPAASWDEWGIFLAHLFATDPGMSVPGVYPDAYAFDTVTGGRFGAGSYDGPAPTYEALSPAEIRASGPLDVDAPHTRNAHRFSDYARLVTGVIQHRCSKEGCTAVRRPVPAPAGADMLAIVRSGGVLS